MDRIKECQVNDTKKRKAFCLQTFCLCPNCHFYANRAPPSKKIKYSQPDEFQEGECIPITDYES